MRYRLAVLLVFAAGAVAAQGRGPDGGGPGWRGDGPGRGPQGGARRHFAANPSALVAAEIELKQASQQEGQWKAFLKAAAPNAELFVPQRVVAAEWLKGRAEPETPAEWQPFEVWMSCDGSYGVIRGAWRQAGAAGRFMTLWQRQEDGSYKWLRRLDDRSSSSDEPDMIAAHVADCSRNEGAPASASGAEATGGSGTSGDKSIYWTELAKPDGAWTFALHSWDGKSYPTVFSFEGPAAPSAE